MCVCEICRLVLLRCLACVINFRHIRLELNLITANQACIHLKVLLALVFARIRIHECNGMCKYKRLLLLTCTFSRSFKFSLAALPATAAGIKRLKHSNFIIFSLLFLCGKIFRYFFFVFYLFIFCFLLIFCTR